MTIGRQIIRITALSLISVLVAGCVDLEQRVDFLADGGMRVNADLNFHPEMVNVFEAFEVRARHMAPELDNRTGGTQSALCEKLGAPTLFKTPPGISFDAYQSLSSEALTCAFRFEISARRYQNSLALLSKGAVRIDNHPDGTTEIALDLTKIPDLSRTLSSTFRELLSNLAGLGDGDLDADAIEEISEADRAALKALTRIAFQARGLQLIVTAERILDSNGLISDDERSVMFYVPFVDIVDAALDAGSHARKRYYAVLVL